MMKRRTALAAVSMHPALFLRVGDRAPERHIRRQGGQMAVDAGAVGFGDPT
jgi:hypothetical protein